MAYPPLAGDSDWNMAYNQVLQAVRCIVHCWSFLDLIFVFQLYENIYSSAYISIRMWGWDDNVLLDAILKLWFIFLNFIVTATNTQKKLVPRFYLPGLPLRWVLPGLLSTFFSSDWLPGLTCPLRRLLLMPSSFSLLSRYLTQFQSHRHSNVSLYLTRCSDPTSDGESSQWGAEFPHGEAERRELFH